MNEDLRAILKTTAFENWTELQTDQKKRLPHPKPEKPCPAEQKRIPLCPPVAFQFRDVSLLEAIRRRKTHREYSGQPLSIEELSFLLWATQGVREVVSDGLITRRTVPSAGSRHPFETYLVVLQVTGLEPGLYRYLAIEHQLVFLFAIPNIHMRINIACSDFSASSAVVFAWSAIPYRTEYRYLPLAPKFIAQDSGHVCQNLYLACEAIHAGACAVGAYDQKAMDELLCLDGNEEFIVYCATVGKIG